MEFLISFKQGGYHELHNEPDGVKEKLVEEVVSFIDDHLTQPEVDSPTPEAVKEAAVAVEANSEPPVSETTKPAAITEVAHDSAKAKM